MASTSQTGRILVLIKPDAVERRLTGEILRRIEAKGYALTALKVLAPHRGDPHRALRRARG